MTPDILKQWEEESTCSIPDCKCAATWDKKILLLIQAYRMMDEETKKARDVLDSLTSINCECSVYKLTDDQFGDICLSRDMLDLARAQAEQILMGEK